MAYAAAGLAYSTLAKEGAALAICTTIDTSLNPEYPALPFALGERTLGTDGSAWVYVKPAAAYAIGTVGYINTSWTFTALTTSNATLSGLSVGVMSQVASATTATATNFDGLWVQVAGGCPGLLVKASSAANVQLYTTVTAGTLIDSSASSAVAINGIVLTTARGGTDGLAPAFLNFPEILLTT